ncbi:MAG: peptide chain release factor 3 [Gammaproteobacteria bacterium]|nr:MAG: peptide chain release factor 3 [Gammaproteobacteria bacterium]
MPDPNAHPARRRRTFAIISHPDAGKTTLTEKLLLYGGAIALAGAVKGRKAARHALSDWMALERERGISVSTSVMQFPYGGCVLNLLDTPGHADFSEDTYRTLTAVDSALMVIDAAKGVEERTRKLMAVCRRRDTPVFTFINKLDREGRDPFELLDEIESVLDIRCAPMTWPIGMGRSLQGIYHLGSDRIHLFGPGPRDGRVREAEAIGPLADPVVEARLGATAAEALREQVELIHAAAERFDPEAVLAGRQTPVYFGSAMHDFGVRELLDDFVRHAPPPRPRRAGEVWVSPEDPAFSGFVFKIQANMDPNHHDRIAFLRICSGRYRPGMNLLQLRTGKRLRVNSALTFLASQREAVEEAWAGDIIGLHNHGTIRIGDSFSEGAPWTYEGIPSFAPELFRRAVLADPLRTKALHKGLLQLSEEGAVQVFRPLVGNDAILGAVGALQFEVAAHRLRAEYGVDCRFEAVEIAAARWVEGPEDALAELRARHAAQLAEDHTGALVYLAPSRVNLNLTVERHPRLRFLDSRERAGADW